MNEKWFLKNIQGKEILIEKMILTNVDNSLRLDLEIVSSSQQLSLIFENVSSLRLSQFSFPICISGFEILSNKDRGWEKEYTYHILDFEDGKIDFYCQDFFFGN